MRTDTTITLTYEQRAKLLQYVALSLILSVILSVAEAITEDAALIPTFGLGSLALDGVFLAVAEFLSRKFEEMADKQGVPHVKGKTQNMLIIGIINLIPAITFIRFGLENLFPAIRGKIHLKN